MLVTDLYLLIFNAVLAGSKEIGHGREGIYVAENGEYSWYDAAKVISQALFKRGLSKTGEPNTFTPDEVLKFFGSEVSMATSLVRSDSLDLRLLVTGLGAIRGSRVIVLALLDGRPRKRRRTCSQILGLILNRC